MNQFYLGLISEEERGRVESLEPFDEHEVSCRFLQILCYNYRPTASWSAALKMVSVSELKTFFSPPSGVAPEMFPLFRPDCISRLSDDTSFTPASSRSAGAANVLSFSFILMDCDDLFHTVVSLSFCPTYLSVSWNYCYIRKTKLLVIVL